ncbi:MAG: SHOCT domain-containing protein [Planctomycetes bacterium]|nr:SHOCT domain-containing protein [Planctomycetota bacterium]
MTTVSTSVPLLMPAAVVNYRELVIAAAVLVAVMVLGCVGVILLGRRFRSSRRTPFEQPFTLDQLRTLYQQGQMTQAEFERTKAAMARRFSEGHPAGQLPHRTENEEILPPQEGTSSS